MTHPPRLVPPAGFSILLAAAALLPIATPPAKAQILSRQESPAEIKKRASLYRLVDVEDAVPGIHVDLQYAKASASGRPLYREDMICFVNRDTAEKLKTAQALLVQQGYSLLVWDAWRPLEAHIALWQAVKDPRYVVPPSRGVSWHCYGVSIDVTLVTSDGRPVTMPTEYDDFSEKASSRYTGGDPVVANNLTILQRAMQQAGFAAIESEWWHFDDETSRGRARIRRATAKDLGIALP